MKLKKDLVKEIDNLEAQLEDREAKVMYLRKTLDMRDKKIEEMETRDKVRLAEVKFYKRVYQDLFLNRNVVLADKDVNFN